LVTTSNAAQASVAPFAKYHLTNYAYQPSFKMKTTMTTARVNGISETEVMTNPNFQAGVGATPADPWYWQLRFSAYDNVTAVAHTGMVHYTILVVFTDPVQDDDNDLFRQINFKNSVNSGCKPSITPSSSGKDEVSDYIVVAGETYKKIDGTKSSSH
jgi:hypothetical protein